MADSPSARNPILASLASLKLTVWLLAAAMVLIFFATIDQVHLGIHEVVRIYFRSFIAYYDIRTGGGWDEARKAVLPPEPVFRLWLPGGYILGTLFLINLVAAHMTRFKLSWKKSGIVLIHAGIVLILLGELFTGLAARETQMSIDEGQTTNYSEDPLDVELAFVDRTDPGREKHIVIPSAMLVDGRRISPPELPFSVEIVAYHPNARLAMQQDNPGPGWSPVPADQGLSTGVLYAPSARAKRLDEINLPLVFIRLHEGNKTLGTWMAGRQIPMEQQATDSRGKNWSIALRGAREYKPFSITLRDFQHTKYPGTEIPKDFSSFITLTEKGLEQGRDVRIWMNHPLRHGGYTFYQHQFKNNDATTVLLVVRNPSWLIPYIACIVVFVGLTLQFGLSLHSHMSRRPLRKPTSQSPEPSPLQP